jgi:superfamily II DNA or RNA helicase
MARLEELTRGASVKGILPDGLVTVVDVAWYGTEAVELTYKDAAGRLGHELLYREREATIELAAASRPWGFDGDGARFRLASEAYRIRLAYLFDPLLAVHSSLVEPLPHQITAVYGEMLIRQPLRFLLADDPGAGKTIMAGLLIKELVVRGDVQRCLIVSPGSLVEQWQDELDRRFHLPFDILTNDKLEAARTGNWFQENPLAIARLDKLSRNDDVQAKLEQTDWDLVIVDEAHKLSATFFGGEISYTKRYRLGQLLGKVTRHLLLLTATPHNGKEEDFQLFMGLLDADRFEGRFRDGVHTADISDLMRRLTKEQLLKFDGRPLFPERIAYTVNYTLSDAEAALYEAVTTYVRQEFNRAEALENNDRKGTVGFALTTLQRRLASSPEAIYQSLRRRRERLQARLQEMRAGSAGGPPAGLELNLDDLDDAPDIEVEQAEDRVVDQATAARTIAELEAELAILTQLEDLALQVRSSGKDRKWDELSQLLQNEGEMFDAQGHRRKLVIFTEHRDTLNYLEERISTLIGRAEAVVVIHGSMGRDERRKARERFTQDPMERAEARRLQPHFIAAFFLEAFKRLGGSMREREPKRYEITHVPAVIRNRDRILGAREGVLQRYERVTFEKERISIPGKPPAAFICPGHPLLDATIDLVLERERDLLKRGAILVSPDDPGETPRTLFYVEHAIQDARTDRSGNRRVVSRQLQFVEIDADGQARTAGYAPYLDYRPLSEEERELLENRGEEIENSEGQFANSPIAYLLSPTSYEHEALRYAISELVPRHFDDVRRRKEEFVTKTLIAVQERLTKEIIYWDQRAVDLQLQEEAGKTPRLNSARARQRRDELEARLRRRTEELAQERRVSPLPPVVIGGALVVPGGLLARLKGARSAEPALFARETKRVELAAMAAVMAAEHTLGFVPRDVSADKCGYDIESRVPAEGRLRFLEVKGRIQGATSVTVTKNEILTALNKPEAFILALVEVPPAEFAEGDAFYTGIADERGSYVTGAGCVVHYVRQPFTREPDFGATSVNYDWDALWARGEEPE